MSNIKDVDGNDSIKYLYINIYCIYNKDGWIFSQALWLTTKNSLLSTIWLPSASNILKAILKPAWGSGEHRGENIVWVC